jgi:hypothetical protein
LIGDNYYRVVVIGELSQEKHVAYRRQYGPKGQQHSYKADRRMQKCGKQHDEYTYKGYENAEHVEFGEVLFEVKHREKGGGDGDGGHNDGDNGGVAVSEAVGFANKIKEGLETAEGDNCRDVFSGDMHVLPVYEEA